ncbi:MAG: hypothetical protein A2790_19975 [Phenylobacterium sp. RIFCSPHIGHO2_01_FULL_69_31]|uniref:LPD7 domain-containing protein n=1 Tax=Phenylobacterium sp. RIFCSPHIGHO2_01_FULL_69_31 TaxID=1801944 RepID=UPI0008B81F59|nr:LPD7 domain-containing protein [Phenylobacterium sp. RIFCSPHIGHO2_01_FULL_69_31]OHB26249.1 MAG: hypothetical protein A2790_19975 [Phenylobacterium sp. RIFCSPHIGHO2_01_FULL_69_31]
MAEDLNIIAPEAEQRAKAAPGEVPEHVRRRYVTDRGGGPGLGFYADARTEVAAFRDHGRRLTTGRNDPHVIRDLVAIAQHRGWTTITVRGHSEFRREVWQRARAAGLDVRGYRPTERDRQEADRRAARAPQSAALTSDAQARLKVVEQVVRARVVEPADQDRILSAARQRLAYWLERGASFSPANTRVRERTRT